MKYFFSAKKPKEECGVFGIYNHPNASELTALGLHALQHRGQDSTGIVTYEKIIFTPIGVLVKFQKFSQITKYLKV